MRLATIARSLGAGALVGLIVLSLTTGYTSEDPVYASAPAGCDTAAVMSDNGPVLPPGATDVSAPFDTVIYNGTLEELYPGLDPASESFYTRLPCEPSIGGTLPDGILADTSEAETAAERYLTPFEQAGLPPLPPVLPLPTIDPFTLNCYIRRVAARDLVRDPGPTPVDPRARAAAIPPPNAGRGDAPAPTSTPAAPAGRATPSSRAAPSPAGGAPALRPPSGPVTAVPDQWPVKCDDASFLRAGQPFEGRDIIYVHGLATGHFKTGLVGPNAPSRKAWPQDASEFLDPGKYFRTYAENYWKDHIREHLFDPANPASPAAGWQAYAGAAPTYLPKGNRYLLVAWSSNQTLDYAQHALITQIQLAMTSHKNVVTPPGYPTTHVRPFCANGCVLVSHSTGGLLVGTAMARAARGDYGQGGRQIPPLMRAHVAFESALSGSRIATVGWSLASAVAGASPPSTLCMIQDQLLEQPLDGVCSFNTAFLQTSILRDLMPIVAQNVWGPLLNQTPVPTVTVAGGHPTGNYHLTKGTLPGIDDGVVSMNSACANPNPVFPGVSPPSGVRVTSMVKAFDMGVTGTRAVKNFISHLNLRAAAPGSLYLAAACQPALTPTGMVLPVASLFGGTPFDARRRYNNHFSFLQGSIDHSYDGGSDSGNPWPSTSGQASSISVPRRYKFAFGTNDEEMSAVTNTAIYARAADGTHLVHPAFAGQMYEEERGRAIRFKLFGKKRTIWIWKRTYHLLNNWQTKQSSHFAYEYVARR